MGKFSESVMTTHAPNHIQIPQLSNCCSSLLQRDTLHLQFPSFCKKFYFQNILLSTYSMLSRSAVETLFSRFKHTAGGKLSSTNYSTARAAHLVKHTVAYHHSSVSYRDVPLHLSNDILEKKQYGCKQTSN